MDPPGDSIAIRVVIIIILLGLSVFFSSSETALTTADKIRIGTLAEGGGKSTQWVMKLSENQGKMLSVILIGDNVVSLLASPMFTVLVTKISGDRAVGAATGILTLLTLIFGGITPKTIAALDAERYSLRVGHMIHILITVLALPIILINWMSLTVLRVLHVDLDKRNGDVTEDELRTIVDVGHEKGVIEPEGREIINNAFDPGGSVAKDVMIPGIGMVFTDIEADYGDLTQIFREEHYTRLPVYKETTDDVMGITDIKAVPYIHLRARET